MSIPSQKNIFSLPLSTSTTEKLSSKTEIHPLQGNVGEQERIIQDVVDKMFDNERGIYEASSSRCSSATGVRSHYSFDKRLQYWKKVIEERKLITKEVTTKIGKQESEVLFNRPTTVDELEKCTVQRLLDYADRMKPERLISLKPPALNAKIHTHTCELNEPLLATLPQPERKGGTCVEISGLPMVSKQEQLGEIPKSTGKWLRSNVLNQRICEKETDILRVLEFYPDIENLQVVGEGLGSPYKRDPKIKVDSLHIKNVSDDTISEVADTYNEGALIELMSDYAMRFNEEIIRDMEKPFNKQIELEVSFTCEPFEYKRKRVARIQNLGKKVLTFYFTKQNYFEKEPDLLNAEDHEFCFDNNPFRLLSGETSDLIVQYQPRRVSVVWEMWYLIVDLQTTNGSIKPIILKFFGKCHPAIEYVEVLDHVMTNVLYKSNLSVMRKLTTGLSTITPLMEPTEVICPYKRALNEKERFELLNVGYKCERYHDLELLKDIYRRASLPRHHPWDLKLDTLKQKILCVEPADKRALIYAEMLAVLEDMKSLPYLEGEQLPVNGNPERERTRYLFVRGIIITAIDEWESTRYNVEESFLQSLLEEHMQALALEEAEDQTGEQVEEEQEQIGDHSTFRQRLLEADPAELLCDPLIRNILTKEVVHKKFFRDSLYMHTYALLCDMMENIVSIIESTEVI